MWLTPWRSNTSSARSASSWLARASAAAPKRVTVDWCPVRPNGRRSIMAASSLFGAESYRRTGQRPVHQDAVVREGVLHRVGHRGGRRDDPALAHALDAQGIDRGREVHVDHV